MIVFDIEGDGLTPTKIWCLSKHEGGKLLSTTDYDKMRSMLERADVLTGHNIIRWDIPQLERLLGVKVRAKLVDTLILSWYLEPNRVLHGLASYGDKREIKDWENLEIEEYVNRCEGDVENNLNVWERQWAKLLKLYGSEEKAWKLIDYLSFKMDCAREQEKNRWKLDTDRAEKVLQKLSEVKAEKVEGLGRAMPKVPKKGSKSLPKKLYKINGDLSAEGVKWFDLLEKQGLPKDHVEDVEFIKDWEEPNPNSIPQMKKWLYSLGWKPETFKYDRNKETGDVRKIEQINKPFGGGVCPSVLRLAEQEPSIHLLDGLSIATHRISILKGFLENVDEEGYVQAQVQGLTNTLRWKHKICVNLPGVDKPYGEDIRGCLIAPKGYVLVGSDMSSLEDRTKQHYMWSHDPEYVKEMMTDDFDPHLDICISGALLSKLDVSNHKAGVADHSKERKLGKAANYACVYGAGGATVARSAGISKSGGDRLVEAYWKRNWSVKAIADECVVKVVDKQKWLYNPVSELWYSLRAEKDRFSTLNQGTGVWCFDTWVKYQRQKGLPQIGQFHDETINLVREENKEKAEQVLRWAIDMTNKELKLNRELDIDVQFGMNYAQIH